MSRAEAREKGLKRYFTGKPCKHDHVAEHLVSNGNCAVCFTARKRSPEYRVKALVLTRTHPSYKTWTSKGNATGRLRRHAARAAKFLTETLGIPHTVVKMEDGTFQPVPSKVGQ